MLTEGPEVEERVAHTRVLVVDDPHVVAVAQEDGVQEIVVGGGARREVRRERYLDTLRNLVRVGVPGGDLHAPEAATSRYCSTIRNTSNVDGIGGQAWIALTERTAAARTSSR